MNAICYVCNEQSPDCRQNFAEVKSQHTRTPIADFIKSILADFDSDRNVDDASNCICTGCLKRIDDYDWTCQQAIEQEAKLRHLLFSTELTLRYLKNGSLETKVKIENRHNEQPLVGGQRDLLGECDIKLEAEDADATPTTTTMFAQWPTPTSPPPLTPLKQAITSNSTFISLVPATAAAQPNPTSTPVSMSKLPNQQKQYVIEQHGQQCKVVRVIHEQQTQTSKTGKRKREATKKPTISPVTTIIPIKPNCIIEAATTTTTTPFGTHPKPTFSYSCLVALALKNSCTGSLLVNEIYDFIGAQFPYFRMAQRGWKSSVRHCLSMNKCFVKTEIPDPNANRTKCLWSMAASKLPKMDEEIQKWLRNDPIVNRMAMANPDLLQEMLLGVLSFGYSNGTSTGEMNKNEYDKPEENATDLINELFGNDTQPMAKRKRLDVNAVASNL